MPRPLQTNGPDDNAEGQVLVLASGGLDSSTLLSMCAKQGLAPSALFVNYGQPAAYAENAAVKEICTAQGAPLSTISRKGRPVGPGEVRGRNAYLLHAALLEFPASTGVIAIGVHAGTGYVDCSPEFLEVMQRSYDLHTNGTITIAAPFLHWTKRDICALARELNLPIAQTHSCEAANLPCGHCRSCRDREILLDRQLQC